MPDPRDGVEPPPPRLVISALSRPPLAPISFSVAAGECVGLSGPSGAGKTLLLRAVADMDPAGGEVRLDGVDRRRIPAPLWRRRLIYVAADAGWWSERVGDHVADCGPATVALLAALGLPADAIDWPVARLSTGEKQRLALARAIILEPAVLLLDEPTSGLDDAATARVEGVLRACLAGGAAVLVVSHDRQQLDRLTRRCLLIDGGRLITPAPEAVP